MSMKLSLISLCFVLLSLVLPSGFPAFAKQKGLISPNWKKSCSKNSERTNTPGAAIAVVSGDRQVFSKGFGVADIETGAPVTPDTLFRIGSVTKMFTAAVLATLAAEGTDHFRRADWQIRQGTELASFSMVTAHQLMSHTAGMTDESPPDYGSHDDSALAAYVRSLNDDYFFTEPKWRYSPTQIRVSMWPGF